MRVERGGWLSKRRSRAERLQALVGDRGTITYVAVPGWEQRAPGWYLEPKLVRDGCDCPTCVAGRLGRRVFVAPEMALAGAVLGAWIERHDPAADAA